MDSCPICYETFSTLLDTVARKLPCGDVVCTQCLRDCFEQDSDGRSPEEPVGPGVRCPECFQLFLFDSVEAIPTVGAEESVAGSSGECEEQPEQLEEISDGKEASLAGDEEVSAPARPSASKLAAFLQSNPGVGDASIVDGVLDEEGDESAEDTGQFAEDRKCKIEGCENRAVQSVGVCPVHTKRASVVSVSAMVHKFQDTKLSSVALKSDKVEVHRGGIAGAGEAGFHPEAIAKRFRRQERLELGEAMALIEAVKSIFREEDNMIGVTAPVMIVGDVHGQYFDLLNILKKWRPDRNLLFLGDYVDRGQFSCEVILHLFALKLRHPTKVFLIRGNHECSAVSAHFGFKDECKAKYGLNVYYRFLLAFQTMPICALITTTGGRIFGCHGGISPEALASATIKEGLLQPPMTFTRAVVEVKRLSDIEKIDRFAEPGMDGPLCDVLWADPLSEDDVHKLTNDEYQQFLDTEYVVNQVRGCSYMFGYHAVQCFLRENELMYMVRAHEVQEEGFKQHFRSSARNLEAAAEAAKQEEFTDEDSDENGSEGGGSDEQGGDTQRHMYPTVLTVFSAPNYCDRYRNKAAVLHVEKEGFHTVNLLEAEPHPDPVQESDVNVMQLLAMGNTCPYMPTNFREFLKVALDLGRAVEPTNTSATGAVNEDGNPQRTPSEGTHHGTASLGGDGAEQSQNRVSPPSHSISKTLQRTRLSWSPPKGGVRLSEGGVVKTTPDNDGRDGDGGINVNVNGNDRAEDNGTGNGNDKADQDEDDENDEGLDEFSVSLVPSFAPKERRSLLKMISAPVLVGGAVGDGNAETAPRCISWDGAKLKAEVLQSRDADSRAERSSLQGGIFDSCPQRDNARLGGSGLRASAPGIGNLVRQKTWAAGSPGGSKSDQYRMAHARDGINEMHPYVLNRRISHQETEEMEAVAAQAAAEAARAQALDCASGPSSCSFESVPPATSLGSEGAGSSVDEVAFTPALHGGGAAVTQSSLLGRGRRRFELAPAGSEAIRDDANAMESDRSFVEASPAPLVRSVQRQTMRRQFSLDLSLNPSLSERRVTESKSRDQLAEIMEQNSIMELAEMEEDVELDPDPCPGSDVVDAPMDDAEDDSCRLDDKSEESSCVNRDSLQAMSTPSPRRSGGAGAPPSPSQILFTHEEIVVLKLLFSLFDRKGKNFITRDDIVAYAEEGGDFAQLREVDACMEAVDADRDGKVGLSDYINFAARLKEIHSLQQMQAGSGALEGSPTPGARRRLATPTPE